MVPSEEGGDVDLGGIDEGGAFCFVAAGGVGGTRGMFSGGTDVSDDGVLGEADVGVTIAPGGGGSLLVAVLLEVPGSTIVSELLTLDLLSALRLLEFVIYLCIQLG